MRFLTILFFGLIVQAALCQTYTPDWESIDKRPTPDWWVDAKFGIFIHWGAYSVPGYCSKGNYAEWYQHGLMNKDTARLNFHRKKYGADFSYYDFADQFKAELYNPDDWARLFEKSGAKYVVLTSKHHDGYCLWPSKEANQTWGFPWNAMERGPKRDLLGDLFKALRRTTVRPGMYYSLYEWFNPLWKSDKPRYVREHMTPQMRELIEKYQPEVFWTDGDWDASSETWGAQQFISWIYNQSPVRDRIVLNDRWGTGTRFHHAGAYSPEYQPDLDFEDHAWEESRGMGFSYGYNREEDAWDYNSTQTLILHLIDKVSRGGNFLLDIGPDGHGKIPPIMQERLLDIGKWLNINGEAIYGTRRWRTPCQWSDGRRDYSPEKNPHIAGDWKTDGDVMLKLTVSPEPGYAVKELFFTYNPKANSLFAIFPKYPDDKKLTIKGITLPSGTEIMFLETREKLNWENSGGNVVVKLPEYSPNKMKSLHAWALKISNFGAFTPKPKGVVEHHPVTMEPSVTIFAPSGATVRYTTDGSEPTESSTAFTRPFSLPNTGTVRAKAFQPKTLASNDISIQVRRYPLTPAQKPKKVPEKGLSMRFIAGESNSVAAVENGKAVKSSVVTAIESDPDCATEKCGQIWSGYLHIGESGGYKFFTESDDGSMLWIDDQLVVNNDGLHGTERREGMMNLEYGFHTFKLVYYNAGGGQAFKTGYARVGEGWKVFSEDLLFH